MGVTKPDYSRGRSFEDSHIFLGCSLTEGEMIDISIYDLFNVDSSNQCNGNVKAKDGFSLALIIKIVFKVKSKRCTILQVIIQ